MSAPIDRLRPRPRAGGELEPVKAGGIEQPGRPEVGLRSDSLSALESGRFSRHPRAAGVWASPPTGTPTGRLTGGSWYSQVLGA